MYTIYVILFKPSIEKIRKDPEGYLSYLLAEFHLFFSTVIIVVY